MASNSYYRPPLPTDFTSRLRQQNPGVGNADPGMVVQPGADPGYNMPNALLGNLNQAPGQQIGGWLPTGGDTNALAPWIDSLPLALEMWRKLTPEQQAMYDAAFKAHNSAMDNQWWMEGRRRTQPRNPDWAEKYPGF